MKSAFTASLCLTALLVSACSNPKSALTDAINQDLSAHPVCVGFGDNTKTTFPTQFGGDITHNSILKVLAGAGLIQMTVRNQDISEVTNGGTYYGKVTTLDLTPKGREKNAWDSKKGFCIGVRKVADIQKWTEPTASDGVQMTEVDYAWQVDDLPFGITRSDFPDLAGMGKPMATKATLKKMNDGWEVVKNDAY